VQKFFADYTSDIAEPYAWVLETGETYEYLSPGPGNVRPFIADGQLTISILAPNRTQARQLGIVVGSALNDADAMAMTWTGSLPNPLRMLRLLNAAFAPITAPGPGVPAVFARVLTFSYEYQGVL
jgi:hypothetical protein